MHFLLFHTLYIIYYINNFFKEFFIQKGTKTFYIFVPLFKNDFISFYFLLSTINFIPVLSSPSTSTSANAGIHTKSTPAGATNPLAIAMAFTAWLSAPAPIACISALLDSFTKPAIAPATEFGFDFYEIFKISIFCLLYFIFLFQ